VPNNKINKQNFLKKYEKKQSLLFLLACPAGCRRSLNCKKQSVRALVGDRTQAATTLQATSTQQLAIQGKEVLK